MFTKQVIRMIFWMWLLLGDVLLWTDIISYSKIMGDVDWFPVINRDMNVVFFHCMATLPITIITFYLIIPINNYGYKLTNK